MRSFFLSEPKLLLFGFFISYFASYGQTFFISIFNLEIRSLLNLSDGQFGLVYSLATLISAFILVWFGKLIDKIDLRIYTSIISLGLSFGCIGMFFLTNDLLILFLIILILSIGSSITFLLLKVNNVSLLLLIFFSTALLM